MMKIKVLFLKAFGPFTGKTLEFGNSPANLHLIYGPNEAGKSSALRAITDFRFGIPQQSKDNFVHEHKHMGIAATLVDAEGKELCLHRRKGRDNTLSCADAGTGDSLPDSALPPNAELALTSGLNRQQFESMFGLDHERLRKGGQALVHGDGEVGASLFEASSGTANVKGLLAALKEDVKRYHSSRGSSAVLNAARKRLDEQKKIYKEEQTRPKAWKDLERNHQRANDEFAEADSKFTTLRRTEVALAELRTILPLLDQHDAILKEQEDLLDIPVLPDNAQEVRVKAEQVKLRAEDDVRGARKLAEECRDEAIGLIVEPLLLNHAVTIDRLAADADAILRNENSLAELEAKVERQRAQLEANAKRISADLNAEKLLEIVPSAAEKALISDLIEQYRDQERRLIAQEEQAKEISKKLSEFGTESGATISNAAQKTLNNALREAQSIGDYRRRFDELDIEIAKVSATLNQSLSDLGFPSIESVKKARPLLMAEIDVAEESFNSIEEALDDLAKESAGINRDLGIQKNRLKSLKAEGEIATLRTLSDARERRNEGWVHIKKAYVVKSDNPDALAKEYDPERPLPEAFEHAQAEADSQADLLRANADRAAAATECESRIQEMTERLQEIGDAHEAQSKAKSEALKAWGTALQSAGLPELLPAALREWLNLRQSCIALYEQQEEFSRSRAKVQEESERHATILSTQLIAAGETLSADEKSLYLLIRQAQDWLELITKKAAKQEADSRTIQTLNQDIEKLTDASNGSRIALQSIKESLHARHTQFLLPADCSPAVLHARLQELDALATDARDLDVIDVQLATGKATREKLAIDAQGLAGLLGESPGPHITDFIDRVKFRLSTSQDHSRTKEELERREREAESTLTAAEAVREENGEVLRRLCQTALVSSTEELPQAEAQSSRKKALQEQLSTLMSQLRQATPRTIDELRSQLADRTAFDLDDEMQRSARELQELEQELNDKREAERAARQTLEQIDGSDRAATAREAMESALADYRAALMPWAQLRLAESLLEDALKRFKERAQAPMLQKASEYFQLATNGGYSGLFVDDDGAEPRLMATRKDGRSIGIDSMSEGTADQLYLALRLSALTLQTTGGRQMPLVLDDVLITSDDERAACVLRTLAKFSETTQVLVFTHHQHLVALAKNTLPDSVLSTHAL